ncbi:MAG: hypothetical protein IJ710_03085 [Prevotella sp.]|nr:hypothetical protein [Prevotella sp.]
MKKAQLLLLVVLCTAITASAQVRRSISILGDSYSTFAHHVTPDTNYVWYPQERVESNNVVSVRQTWWHQLILNNGFRLCVNNSFSGATICNTGYQGADYSDRSYCTRLNRLGSPDIIIVFGGTNDTWAHSPIGDYKYDGWSAADLYQFRPAMSFLLSGLLDRYPGTAVYVVINDILSDDVTHSMQTICDYYAVPYIQLHDIDKQSGHPSILGMQQIAEQVAAAIK